MMDTAFTKPSNHVFLPYRA